LTIFFKEIIKCNRAKLKVALQAGLKEDFPHSVEWYARDLCHLSAHPVVVEIDNDPAQVKVNELDSVIHRSCHHSELARFQSICSVADQPAIRAFLCPIVVPSRPLQNSMGLIKTMVRCGCRVGSAIP
jgi:hypothetical protein